MRPPPPWPTLRATGCRSSSLASIGIDPGTQTGFALLGAGGERISSGVWGIGPRQGEPEHMRWVYLATNLRGLIERATAIRPGEPVTVAYEHAFPGTSVTADLSGGHIAIIEFVAYSLRASVRRYEISTLKKHATGTGRATKVEMIRAANARWNLALPFNEHLGEFQRTRGGVVKTDARGNPLPKLPTFPGGSDNHADALWVASAAMTLAGTPR